MPPAIDHSTPDLRPLQAIGFDLDGTLVDTLPDIAEALNRALAEEARPALAESAVAPMVGGNANDVAAARAVRVPVILVCHGYTTFPARTPGADAVIDRFGELRNALARIAGGARRRVGT